MNEIIAAVVVLVLAVFGGYFKAVQNQTNRKNHDKLETMKQQRKAQTDAENLDDVGLADRISRNR